VRLNAVVGFTNMMMRLWESERPAAVLVGWDSLETPTYRHEAFAGYQAGRVFDESLLDQLALLPESAQSSASSSQGARLRGRRLPRRGDPGVAR
jgi:5'-3' exonuclease